MLLALASPMALADPGAQDRSAGLVEDSTWSLVNRTVYDSREYRHGA
ncbi:outer membrane porin, OprD family, partial [Pseudomonas fragi]|nr:outer membrane porin, OprD family [Pseudomonas sp. GC01]